MRSERRAHKQTTTLHWRQTSTWSAASVALDAHPEQRALLCTSASAGSVCSVCSVYSVRRVQYGLEVTLHWPDSSQCPRGKGRWGPRGRYALSTGGSKPVPLRGCPCFSSGFVLSAFDCFWIFICECIRWWPVSMMTPSVKPFSKKKNHSIFT